MSTPPEPHRRVKCTFAECEASFGTEKEMKRHKRNDPLHDYCQPCDEDFESVEDYVQHKAFRPDNHGKACRVCGDEFHTSSGMKRHIELVHKVDQKLACAGCGANFYRACLLIEHLEFGHCPVISAVQFQGHIVHKHLISELMKGGHVYERFMQKISRFDAALDDEEEGGVILMDENDHLAESVDYKAMEPEVPVASKNIKSHGPYPPLPSQPGNGNHEIGQISSKLGGVSLKDDVKPMTSSTSEEAPRSSHTVGIWSAGNSAGALFPEAKATPRTAEPIWTVEEHDRQVERSQGINILTTRFWDPTSDDFQPDRFYDTVLGVYYCPFPCEQSFAIPKDLNKHIFQDHRITKMRCPSCLKYFRTATALMSHCESRNGKCQISKADDYGTFLDRLTGGFLGVDEKIRADHTHNPAVMVTNPDTGKVEKYRPPVASYLQYYVTRPSDWKEPKATLQIGGGRT